MGNINVLKDYNNNLDIEKNTIIQIDEQYSEESNLIKKSLTNKEYYSEKESNLIIGLSE